MTHVWNDHYGALYDRTYKVLCTAGLNEKLAHELATRRTLAAALMARGYSAVSSTVAPSTHHCIAEQVACPTRLFIEEPLYEQSVGTESQTHGKSAPKAGHASR